MAYELDLPPELSLVYPVFHVSMLRKCLYNEAKAIPVDEVEASESLTYEEVPIKILDRQVRRLRPKDVVSVKVLWLNHKLREATWEAKEDMKKRYPHLFGEEGM